MQLLNIGFISMVDIESTHIFLMNEEKNSGYVVFKNSRIFLRTE